MTYTSDPTNSVTDAIRLTIGDTDNTNLLFTDGELSYFYSQGGNSVSTAAIFACYSLSSKYSRLADEELGQAKVKWSQLAKAFSARAMELEKRKTSPATAYPIPFAGGVSVTDTATRDSNTDRVANVFDVGLMDNTN